jgi:nicotinamide phosphoribosyltransferase
MYNDNPILATDSYKASHYLQYPPEMRGMFSYVESRGGQYDHVLFFGLRAILRRYLERPITMEQVEEASEFFAAHGEPFPLEGWTKVVQVYGGIVPLVIRAVPEGTVVPTHNVLMTVQCTDPDLYWLVSWFETLLMRVWYPTTVATQSMYAKKAILTALQLTADDPEAEIAFKLHDFGARGVSSGESAAIGGAAHLVNFMGSDTVEGVVLANKIYGAGMAGFSIPAAEHSTITAWGQDREVEAYRNILNQFAKEGSLVAAVSDSYNLWDAIEHLWGNELRQQVIDSGATVVIRPDSGVPHEVVLKALQMLDAKFGHTVNQKGYRVLNNVRVIQGDGITADTIPMILDHAIGAGYSASNIAFGMGGGLLQQVNRDTQRFAYKCSAVLTPTGWVGVNKDPITDPGKASKAGRLTLFKENGAFRTGLVNEGWGDKKVDVLETVYNGDELNFVGNFDEVRARARTGLDGLMQS